MNQVPPHRPDAGIPCTDPLHLFRFIEATSFLRQIGEVQAASKAIVRALWPDDCQERYDTLMDTGFEFPSRRPIERSRPRLDITCNLLIRRWFHTVVFAAASFWICLYADSSPVSGYDIFGMICDVFVDGVKHTFMLPGSVLGHGHTSALDKTMALLWAIWLACGPDVESFERVVMAIICITTDQGVESYMVDVANIVDAFLVSLKLRASRLFTSMIYTFPRAVGIPDWEHMWSGLLKHALLALPTWPITLAKLRAVVKCFFPQFGVSQFCAETPHCTWRA